MALAAVACIAEAGFGLLKVEGKVDLNEIGGRPLYVVSTWADDPRMPLPADGNFVTTICNLRPQKLSIIDEAKKTRAMAIVIPGASEPVIFDARSTAMAVLLRNSGDFGSSSSVIALSKAMDKAESFKELAAYLKKNLPEKPLESLLSQDDYVQLVEKCERDIFGQDQQKIRDSLKTAEKKLEKVL